MRRIKAVVYGVGAMNSIATRLMLEKGVDIVGALARSPEKVGRDLGEVAGLGHQTGVVVENDPDRVLSTRQADIAVIAVASYMSDMYEHLRRCAEHGVNAVTISEEALYPWNTAPMQTAELDRLARLNGVTITGTGHQDVYWVNLVSMVLATAHRIEAVTGRASWNVDDYGREVARDQRVDTTVEDFDRWLAEADRPPSFGRNTLGALVDDLGLTVAAVDSSTRPEVAEQPVASGALGVTVQPGRVIGFTDVDAVRTHEGITLTFEMTGRLYLPGEADINEWTVSGEPELRLSNPAVPTQMTTCTQLVNRIPDVINAPPGFITMEKLPRPRYRTYPLGMYLDERSA
jgi:2,4-diaminopentanoate dehydrogenase